MTVYLVNSTPVMDDAIRAAADESIGTREVEYKKPVDLLGPNGLLKQLTGALVATTPAVSCASALRSWRS